jgi:ribosome recycling factor
MIKSVAHTQSEMSHIRTGKASPTLLDAIKVDLYGSHMPLKQVATVNAPEPRMLAIQPFDKGTIHAIEKAILASDLGLTPQNDGRVIRLPIPMLTAARREELVKVVRKFAEEGRVSIRNLRRDANEHIKKGEKAHEVSEDDGKRMLDQIQKDTDHFIAEIDHLLKVREAEIREE